MRFIIIFFLLISVKGLGQWKDYKISVRGDTLNRVDLNGKKQGPWVIHTDDHMGERGYEEEGYFENDNKEGTWKRFSLEGVKIAEENYHWGKLHGASKYFTYNGGLLRIESWRAMDPANAYDTVTVYDLKDPSKILENVVVKNDGYSVKHGKWTYYDPAEGTVTGTETYWLNKLQTEDNQLLNDEDVKPLSVISVKAKSDTVANKKVTKPKEVLEYEKKNAGKKKIKVRDGTTGNLPEP